MRLNPTRTLPIRLMFLAASCALFAATALAAQARELKFEAQLIWATMSETSPDPKHKAVDPVIRKKLEHGPLKFKHYFLVRKQALTIPEKGTKEAVLSDKCKISVKDLDGGKTFEVALVGKGEPVLKRTQKMPPDELLVLGGNAPDATAWLVVLKRVN